MEVDDGFALLCLYIKRIGIVVTLDVHPFFCLRDVFVFVGTYSMTSLGIAASPDLCADASLRSFPVISLLFRRRFFFFCFSSCAWGQKEGIIVSVGVVCTYCWCLMRKQ